MNRNPSTHYRVNKGDQSSYCYAYPAIKMTDDWRRVTCKKCKTKKGRQSA